MAVLLLAVAWPLAPATVTLWETRPPRATVIATETPTNMPTPLGLALSTTPSHDPDRATPGPAPAPSPEAVPAPDRTEEVISADVATGEAPAASAADPAAAPADDDAAPDTTDVTEKPADPIDELGDVSPSKVEARLLAPVNAERRAAGPRELEPAGDLVRIARDWSDVMASTGNFRHNPKLAAQMCCHSAFGENVAWGGVPDRWLMESTCRCASVDPEVPPPSVG